MHFNIVDSAVSLGFFWILTMNGFTKLFSSIVTSTIWQEDSDTKVVWVTMLALVNADGFVDTTIPGLANIANVSVEKTREAIAKFESPDPDSRTIDHDGRRIAKVDNGWFLLNHAKYRKMRNPEERKEYMRKYMKEYRKQNVKNVNNVNSCKPQLAHTDTEAEADTVKQRRSNNYDFDLFWSEYPRKIGKKKCRGIWSRLKPSPELVEKILSKVRAYKETEQWRKDDGKFIPHPSTWLNAGQWDDEIKQESNVQTEYQKLVESGDLEPQ